MNVVKHQLRAKEAQGGRSSGKVHLGESLQGSLGRPRKSSGAQGLGLDTVSCVIPGKLLHLSGPQLPSNTRFLRVSVCQALSQTPYTYSHVRLTV